MGQAWMFVKLASLRGDALLSSPRATPGQHLRILALLGGILAQVGGVGLRPDCCAALHLCARSPSLHRARGPPVPPRPVRCALARLGPMGGHLETVACRHCTVGRQGRMGVRERRGHALRVQHVLVAVQIAACVFALCRAGCELDCWLHQQRHERRVAQVRPRLNHTYMLYHDLNAPFPPRVQGRLSVAPLTIVRQHVPILPSLCAASLQPCKPVAL